MAFYVDDEGNKVTYGKGLVWKAAVPVALLAGLIVVAFVFGWL